jgi:sodium transport system permease protein
VVPGAELSPFYSVVPVTGAALLLQDLMTAPSPDRIPWLYIAPVLLPMGAYCYLALNWAIQQFKREEVLFREAERLDLGLMVRRVFREKEPLPSAAMAMTLFGMLLAFGWLLRTSGTAAHLLAVTAVHQLAFVATPALMMGLLLTSRPLLTLRLAPPAPRFILLSLGLAACLHVPLALTTGAIIRQFPHIAEQAQRFVEHVIDLGTPFWLYLLIMAALPAVCEELAFRGFIFSGLVRRFANGRAVVVASSLLFALYHMNALQLIPTFLLGLVLGLLAQRSGSLLPGLLLHFIHNGLAFAVSYYGYRATKTGTAPPAWLSEDTVYNWPVAALGAGLGLVLLVVLYRQPIPPLPRAPADRPALEPE